MDYISALFFICAKINFTLEKYISETQQLKFNHKGDTTMRLTNKKENAKLSSVTNSSQTLTLITTESFGDLSCNFYKNSSDDILLTREQIGQALEYANPIKAIQKIHLAHQDRLEKFCLRIKPGHPQTGDILSKSEEQERVYYTERGIMEICRWSRQPKADLFMDWTWDIISKYRKGELCSPDQTKILETLASIQQDINQLRQEQTQIRKSLPKKKYSYWTTKMMPKYQILKEHFNLPTNKDLYRELYIEFSNTYPNIDLNQLADDYCTEHNLETCFTLDAIEENITVRNLFTEMVDFILETHHLEEKPTMRRSVFEM